MTATTTGTMREVFARTVTEAMDTDERLAVVTAVISATLFDGARARHPHRVLDVGIREQAMIGVAGGLALTGMRPVVHSYAPFLVERPFEQVKLDFGHQGTGAVLVGIGGSHDEPSVGRTHQAPEDVALLGTLPGWRIHVPGHPAEAEPLLREALAADDLVYLRLSGRPNAIPRPVGAGFTPVRHGSLGVVLAVGPTLDAVLAATEGIDVTVLYTPTVRPFDHDGLRAAVASSAPAVVLVEPYLRGTSAHEVAAALERVPHRLRSIGVGRDAEVRRYGTAHEHDVVHGLDARGIAGAVREFLEW